MAKDNYINFYIDDPTAEATDGTLVSIGDMTNPISAIVNASKGEAKVVKTALRTEPGYETSGDTTVYFTGPNADKWSVGLSEDGEFASSLTIPDTITNANTIFYVKFAATLGELPDNDTTTKCVCATEIARSL
jgi:hypothetical protein